MPRPVDLAVCSDLHLGTPHCRAEELLAWLEAIEPRRLVLNGDIVDLERMGRWRWPTAQRAVAGLLLAMAEEGVETWFITGNHDDALRALPPLRLGGLRVVDRLELEIGGLRTLFLHGDLTEPRRRWQRALSVVGGLAYDAAMRIDRGLRPLLDGRSLMAAKERLPGVAAHIAGYEVGCARVAAAAGCAAVVAGHIHQPRIRRIAIAGAEVLYLNSGDWVEHGTALEWDGAAWSLAGAAGFVAAVPGHPSVVATAIA